MMREKAKKEQLWLVLLFTAVTMWSLFDLTGVMYQKPLFWGGALFSALLVLAVFLLKRRVVRIGVSCCYLALMLYMLWRQRELFADGFWHVVNRILSLVNQYYKLEITSYLTTFEEAEAVTVFFLFFVQLLLWIYAISLAVHPLRWLGRMLLVAAAGIGMAVGLVPDFWVMGAVVLCVFLTLLPQQHPRAILLPAALFLGLFLLGSLVIDEEYYEEHLKDTEQKQELLAFYEEVNSSSVWDELAVFVEEQKQKPFWERLDFFGKKEESGGLSGGRFSSFDAVEFQNVTALKVTLPDVGQSVYLKGYVGVTYTGSGWEEHNKTAKKKYAQLLKSNKHNAQDMMSWYLRLQKESQGTVRLWRARMSVDYVTANTKYMYAPYYWETVQEGKLDYVQDTYVKPAKQREHYSYEYYFIGTDQMEEIWDTAVSGRIEEHAEWEAFEAFEQAYREYVYEVYTELPEGHNRLKNLHLIQENATTAEKVQKVIEYLLRYQYTLEPGALPEGEDFVDYFLFENKKGYCVHFASAAVLMLRSMGVPARYAEGYLVSREDIRRAVSSGETLLAGFDGNFYWEETVEEKMVEVKDYSGHAWVEVYCDGFGWVPVEVTYGSSGESVERLPEEIYESVQALPTPTPLPTNTPAPTFTPTPLPTAAPTKIPTPTEAIALELPEKEDITAAPVLTPDATKGAMPSEAAEQTGGEQPEEKSFEEWLETLSLAQRLLYWYGIVMLGIVLSIVLCMLLILLRYKLVWRLRVRKHHSRRNRVLWYYHAMEELFAEYQLRLRKEESYQQFLERVMEFCPIVPENFPQVLELALRARFDRKQPLDEEIILVREAYLVMRQRFYEGLSTLRRLYYKFLKLY